MNNDINLLLQGRKKLFEKKNKSLVVIQIIAIISVLLVLFSTVIIFILKITSPFSSLQVQENEQISSLTKKQVETVEYALTEQKLEFISQLLLNRKDLSSLIVFLQGILTSEITIDALSIDTKTISLTLTSNSLGALNTLFDTLVSGQDEKKKFKDVQMHGIVLSPDTGNYEVELTIMLL